MAIKFLKQDQLPAFLSWLTESRPAERLSVVLGRAPSGRPLVASPPPRARS